MRAYHRDFAVKLLGVLVEELNDLLSDLRKVRALKLRA